MGGGSDGPMNTLTERPASAQPRTAAHGREVVLETFRKTNILRYQIGEIKRGPYWRRNKAIKALASHSFFSNNALAGLLILVSLREV